METSDIELERLANVQRDVDQFKTKGTLKDLDEEILFKNIPGGTKKNVLKYAAEILQEAENSEKY